MSKSYLQIRGYLSNAGIDNPELVFFYAGKPRMPLPNVTCFRNDGVQLRTPPQCFGYIKDYITLLGDSIMPVVDNGQLLSQYLGSVKMIDAYDQEVKADPGQQYDYYLFIDFLAITSDELQKTLRSAVAGVNASPSKIKLFLVHALSEKNAMYFKGDKGTKRGALPAQ